MLVAVALFGLERCAKDVAANDAQVQTAAGDEPATGESRSFVQRVAQRVMQPFHLGEPAVIRNYELPSSFYGLWPRTEVFGHDARCTPTAFAPRGHGWPKHLAPYRADYAPYRVKHPQSMEGPAWWHLFRRTPCCDCNECPCRCCCRPDYVQQP
ncbi:MAG: hypothetical protein DWQ34_02405 [Planctomycetota bacterium]|nr:MAG: hypothetical protein DWQ29_14660 [Planctomycetota bacterium]REJ97298.1 MAG: hypothetical protein DWQ34_02405 [Planctomycetota bacterium]REK23046.1 MAG: hypothetical protein DWQ41_17895 [Planctomycetota bacterium]REK34062.1 MAG: hypothetical protein DWQ45_13925 [Planctomycetota bacterium]